MCNRICKFQNFILSNEGLIMNKSLLVSLCAATLILTACDKKTNESTTSTSSTPATTAPAQASLSTGNSADMKSDSAAIQTLSSTRAQEALTLQQEMMKAAQNGDKSAITGIVDNLKTYITNFNNELDGLMLKSSEGASLREKMKEANNLSLSLSEESIKMPPDTAKLQQLQTQAMELQKNVLAEMQALQAVK